MISPLPIAEFLDMIKEMYEGSEFSTVYKIVKSYARYDGSMPVVCDKEIVYNYDDLCIKMFDLDVSGWELYKGIDIEIQKSYIGTIYNVVTIRMARMI